jgi:hypothetical protein
MEVIYNFGALELGNKVIFLNSDNQLNKGVIVGVDYLKTKDESFLKYRIGVYADSIEFVTVQAKKVFETKEEAVEFLRRQKEIEIEEALKNLKPKL